VKRFNLALIKAQAGAIALYDATQGKRHGQNSLRCFRRKNDGRAKSANSSHNRPEIKDTPRSKIRSGRTADYTYMEKYGIRDYRGGGRSSARETAMRVAAGAIARKILGTKITVRGAMVQMGDDMMDRKKWDWAAIQKNPFWCPDAKAAARWPNNWMLSQRRVVHRGRH